MGPQTPSAESPAGTRRPAWLLDSVTGGVKRIGPILGQTVLPFCLVVYLALRGGGYDAIVRSEVGLAVWWVVLFGSLAGVLPLIRPNRAAWLPFCLLAGLAVWTALAMLWTESGEETFEEIARLGIYVGVFALALSVQNREGLRRTVQAVAAAIGLVALLALLSRLHPAWFPADELNGAASNSTGRLNYPVNYWNALATLVAMGVPLLVAVAADARRLLSGALAVAALPVLALVVFYTYSRTGLFAGAAALVVLVAAHPDRARLLGPLAVGGAASLLLLAAAAQRDALEAGPTAPGAAAQGDEMLAATLLAAAGAGLLYAGLRLASRHGLIPRPRVPASRIRVGVTTAAVAVLGVLLVAGAPGQIADAWEDFKDPNNAAEASSRFSSASGNGRYQYWEASVDAGAGAPLTGIGPGAWSRWWEREGEVAGYVRFAHSLYLETFAELGLPGLLLVLGFVGAILAGGAIRLRRSPPERRALLAAALGACTAFAIAAGLDWTWQVTVVPVVFLFCAAALLVDPTGDPPPRGYASLVRRSPVPQAGLALLAVASVAVIAVSMSYFKLTEDADEAIAAEDAATALEKADDAAGFQPFAALPQQQRAVALRMEGDLDGASAAARAAVADDPGAWRAWFVLHQIERQRGNLAAADWAYAQARALNPRSSLVPPRSTETITDAAR